ncbi:MAG: AmpG family muropeptide MFS transporter [Bradymonadales bacterium]|nr:AmpG family muropeptide MFS transporter [Bradymonadales bacterium]
MGEFIRAFSTKRVNLMLALGFASGLPLLMTGSTLSAWMFDVGVDLTTIGIFALVTLPYSLKPLWAPLLDRFRVPLLGRRRGWMATFQLLLFLSIGAMGFSDPAARPGLVAVLAVLVAFFSASQDVVADAYRTDVLPGNERGSGTALWVMGYRIAMLVTGAGALMLTGHLHWWAIYLVLGSLMLLGVVATWLAPEPQAVPQPRSVRAAVVEPFLDFFGRRRALLALLFVMLYKVGDAVAGHLITPFLRDIGFEWAEIGAIQKGLGMVATIVGALVGGGLVAKLGLKWSLFIFGILQAVANVLYMILAETGGYTLLVAAIGIDNLCGGLGTTAFVAFLMALCNKRFSAFQYALLSSASSLAGRMLSAFSGLLAEGLGWSGFFLITIMAAAPALVLIWLIPASAEGEAAVLAKPEKVRRLEGDFFVRRGWQSLLLLLSLLGLIAGAILYRSFQIRLPGVIAILLGLVGLGLYSYLTNNPVASLKADHLLLRRRGVGRPVRIDYGDLRSVAGGSGAQLRIETLEGSRRGTILLPRRLLGAEETRRLAEEVQGRLSGEGEPPVFGA